MQREVLGTDAENGPGSTKRVTTSEGNIYIWVQHNKPGLKILAGGNEYRPEFEGEVDGSISKIIGINVGLGRVYVWTDFKSGTHFRIDWTGGPWNGQIFYHGHVSNV